MTEADRLVQEFLGWFGLGCVDEAMKIYHKFTDEQRTIPEVVAVHIAMLFQSGMIDECQTRAADELRRDKSKPEPWIFFAGCLHQQGFHDLAHFTLNDGVKHCPGDVTLLLLAAKSKVNRGLLNQAHAILEQVKTIDPKMKSSFFLDFEEARAFFYQHDRMKPPPLIPP